MKTIVCLSILVSFSSFAQTQPSDAAGQKYDINGFPSLNRENQVSLFEPPKSLLRVEEGAYSFENIRYLEELNNQSHADAYPWISGDGKRLYFIQDTTDERTLMFATRSSTDAFFSSPVQLPLPFLVPLGLWFSSDELDVYGCSSDTLYHAHRPSVNAPFGSPSFFVLPTPKGVSFFGPSLNAAQTTLYISTYSTQYDGIVEYERPSVSAPFVYKRTWSSPRGYSVLTGQVAKDDLTMFLTVKTVPAEYIQIYQVTKPTEADTFSMKTFQQVLTLNAPGYNSMQASVSDHLAWMVFVRTKTDTWNEDDLYIANKEGGIVTAFEPEVLPLSISLFPNPSTGVIHLYSSQPKLFGVEIMDQFGKKVYQHVPFNSSGSGEIDLSDNAKGIYFVKVTEGEEVVAMKKVVIE